MELFFKDYWQRPFLNIPDFNILVLNLLFKDFFSSDEDFLCLSFSAAASSKAWLISVMSFHCLLADIPIVIWI